MKKIATIAALLALASCAGPNPVRVQQNRTNYTFASKLAGDYFAGKPAPDPEQQGIVIRSLEDWRKAIESDEAALRGDGR